MQIVIRIPKEKEETLIKHMKLDRNFRECEIVELPKGHGRLIDVDEIDHYMLPSEKQDKKTWFVHSEEYRNAVLHFNHAMRLLKDNAPTIVGADKAESEARNE